MAFGFFDGQKADASPESIKRRREMIARMLSGNSRAPRNIGEGFQAIGTNLAAAIEGSRADAEEKAGNAERSRIMGGIGFGGAPMASAGNPVATGSATGSGATRAARGGPVDPAVVDGIIATAQDLGVDPAHLLTSVSYETGGTFNPKQLGPRTQWGQHKGLIQFGEPQAKQHGVDWNNPIGSQLGPNGAIASYLRSTGVKPGMGLLDIYSAINAGGVGRYNRSDANNGGAPGTVRDKVEQQMAGHRARAMALLQERSARPIQTASAGPQSNEAQMQDGAGELQAGGSEMMGLAGVGVNPAAPPDMAQIAGAQGIADNEEQTRAMEAQMAADQGLPYAGNEPGLLSPVPMGFGPNPFLPRDMVQPPDAMAQAAPTPIAPTFTGQGVAPSWAGDAEALAPGAQEASGPNNGPFPTPPPRPADLRPQSPLIPPAMRQPIAPMEASENGAGAMQFIESEFARREGRPDPRMAIGAPQGYNPFVPQALQAPQMAGDGGSVQGASQGGEMAGGSAQPQQAGMITPQNVRAVMSSPFTSDADKRFVMDMWNQQQARVQAEAERARVAEQNRQTARDLGLPESLGGVAPVVTARAQQKYAKPEPATSDQRELEQINKERRDANLPALRMDEWKTQKARAGAASVSVDASQKAESAFSVETGKALAKRFDEMVGEGDAAAQNLEVVADLRRLGTGIGTGAYAVVQSYLGKLGIKTEGLSQIEAYNALIDRLTPQQRLPGSGATSDFDAKMFKGSLTSLMNTPEGNNLIVDSMERIIQNRIARGDIALRVQTGELSQREGLAEIRKLQAQARDISTAARDFGKTKTITTDRPGAAQPQQGQPTAAEIEAELKRRGLR
jgi:hypothetical protein